LSYIATKAVYIVVLVTGHSHDATDGGLESTRARLFAVGGCLLIIAGSILPFLAARATRAHTWMVAYRNLRQLYPLWELLFRATPGIALDPPTPDNGPVTFAEHLSWMAQVADHLRDADVTGCQEATDDPGTTPTPRTTP
jgi:uncharacterized membrane protein YjgN (DUF898 family)